MTNSKPKSWRAVLPIHPAAELFPLMSESELRELGEDIKKNGLQNLITLCNYNNELAVLDGRNRLDAMELAGMKTWGDDAEIFRACETDPYDFVLSANINRRHLTEEQRRELIAKVIKAKPEASDRAIAKKVKRDHKTVAKVRKKMESTGEVSPVEKRVGADGKKRRDRTPRPKAPMVGSAEYERDRNECIALNQKAVDAERETARLRATSSAEISVEERRAQNAALDLVDQAIRLVEQMTADQRREFIARLSDTLKVVIVGDSIPADLSIPDSLKRAPTNGRVST